MIDTRRIRAVFFDAAGTLFDVRGGSVGAIYAAAMERHGASLPPGVIQERFREAFSLAPPLAFPGAHPRDLPLLERAWWRDLVAEVMGPAGPFERFDQCFEELFELFRTARGWELDPQAHRVLDVLAAQGQILGVITNFDSRVRDVLRHLGIAPYFRSVVLASEEGFAKPHPGLFRAAMRRLHLEEGEAIYVGDDPENDVEGARAAGMIPILIDPRGGPFPPGSLRIASLGDLVVWLQGARAASVAGGRP